MGETHWKLSFLHFLATAAATGGRRE